MASLQRDPSGNFHVKFRFSGKQYKRSLYTKLERKAGAAASHIEENIRLVNAGRMELPEDVDIPTFLMSDGKLAKKPTIRKTILLEELFPAYLEQTPEGALEPTTQKTSKLHMQHLSRILGEKTSLRTIRLSDLQRYVTARSKEPGTKGKISAGTIRKELSTFGTLWNWAYGQEYVSTLFSRRGIVFPKFQEKPPFQTWEQIEQQIQKDGLNEKEASHLWECLYLSREQIAELLEYVKENSNYEFLYSMCSLAAFTGVRRSELCRLKNSDVDFDQSTVTIHERKRARGTRTTRLIPLAKPVRDILLNWSKCKSDSKYLFSEDRRVTRSRKNQENEGAVSPDAASHRLKYVLSDSKWNVLRGWHTLRHSFISNCATKGIDQRFIDTWVGHMTDEQRRRYRHLFPDSQQKAINEVFQ